MGHPRRSKEHGAHGDGQTAEYLEVGVVRAASHQSPRQRVAGKAREGSDEEGGAEADPDIANVGDLGDERGEDGGEAAERKAV